MKCRRQWPLNNMDKTRVNVCKPCNASYKSLSRRWASHRQLKQWWDNLTDDQRVCSKKTVCHV